MTQAVVVVVGYLLGTLPFAHVIAGRWGVDPTAVGSGNPGASNVYRTAGRRAGAAVLLCDGLKGAAAVGLALAVGSRELGLVAGLAAVLGHVFPLTRRFRGGKGVATAAGVAVVLFPLHLLGAALLWLAVAGITRLASLASIVALTVLLVSVIVTGAPGHEVAVLIALGLVVLARHRGNIARLARGAERPLTSQP